MGRTVRCAVDAVKRTFGRPSPLRAARAIPITRPSGRFRDAPHTGVTAVTQTSNRFFDDLAKLVTDAAGVAQGLGKEVETAVKARAESFVADFDLVKREEVEVLRDMVVAARAENETLKGRLDALEARLAKLEGGKSDLSETLVAGTPEGPSVA